MTKRRKTSRAARFGFYGLSLLTVVNGCRSGGHEYSSHTNPPLTEQSFVATELAESSSRAANQGKNLDGTPIQGHRIQIRPYDESAPAPAPASDIESAGKRNRASSTPAEESLVGKDLLNPPSFIRSEPKPADRSTPKPIARPRFEPITSPEPLPTSDVDDAPAVETEDVFSPALRKPVFNLEEELKPDPTPSQPQSEREVPLPSDPFDETDPLETVDPVEPAEKPATQREPIDLEATSENVTNGTVTNRNVTEVKAIGNDDPMTLEKFFQIEQADRPEPPAKPEAPIVLDEEQVGLPDTESQNVVPVPDPTDEAIEQPELPVADTEIVDDFQPVTKPRTDVYIPRVSNIPNLPRTPIDLTPKPGELDLAPTSDLPEVQFKLQPAKVNAGPKQPTALPQSPKVESQKPIEARPEKPEAPIPAIDANVEVLPQQKVTQPPSDFIRQKPSIPTPEARRPEQSLDSSAASELTRTEVRPKGMLRLAARGLVSTGQSVNRYYRHWTEARQQTLAAHRRDRNASELAATRETTLLEPVFADVPAAQVEFHAEGVVLQTVARLQDYPFALLVDRSGNMFVSHNNGVSRFDASGASRVWSPIRAPRGSAMLVDGSLIVADRSRRQLGRFSNDGKFLGDVISPDNLNRSKIRTPNHVAIDGAGGVYFTDPGFIRTRNAIGKIHYVDSTRRLTTLATDLAFPEGIVFDPVTQRLFVAESQRGRVLTFNVDSPGKLGTEQVFARVAADERNSVDGLSLNSKGELFVACQEARKVLWFGVDGVLKAEIPMGDLIVSDVKVSPVDDNVIYIAGGYSFEKGSGRIMRVRLSELAKMDRQARLDVP